MSKVDPRLLQWRSFAYRVSGTLSRYSMCARGEQVAVAVSGGADSVCLLHVLHQLAPALGIQLSIAHLNHKLRGAASDGDAAFVRELAASLGLPFHYAESNVASAEDNLEQAGRLARLEFSTAFRFTGWRPVIQGPIRRRRSFTVSCEARVLQAWRGFCRLSRAG